MPRELLDRGLMEIKNEVMVLGGLVNMAVMNSIDALMKRNLSASRTIITEDRIINNRRYEIEHKCLTLIATQQPLLASVLEIIMELERMGDYAKGIGKINLLLGDGSLFQSAQKLPQMANIGLRMLARSLDAFMNVDIQLAEEITKEDDLVDDLYNQVYRELIDEIIKDPTSYDRVNYTLWAAHDLERLADRVMNICERTVFIHTGEVEEFDHQPDSLAYPQSKNELPIQL
jgi:phosphate transport system protein